MYWEFCSAGLICVDRIDTDKANAFFNQIFCNFSIYIRMVENASVPLVLYQFVWKRTIFPSEISSLYSSISSKVMASSAFCP